MVKQLVSIIMPAYNCAEYIGMAISSVQCQTYVNWELIIVDDCSSDDTQKVVENFCVADSRIRYKRLAHNSGAAVARNTAVELSEGQYLAFLDSDDIWYPEKLDKQLRFMSTQRACFSCTAYEKIDETGQKLGIVVRAKQSRDYRDLLKSSPGNSTVMYDASVLGKQLIPDIRKRNDYVMWLQTIKKSKILHGFDEILSAHRIRPGSLSIKKTDLVKYHWQVYREIEKLSFFLSCKMVAYWVLKTVLKLDKERNVKGHEHTK